MPQSQVRHTIPNKGVCRQKQRNFLDYTSAKRWARKWEKERIFEKQDKDPVRKKCRGSLQLTGRTEPLNSLLPVGEGVSQSSIPTHAWCWRAHSLSSNHRALHLWSEAVAFAHCPYLYDSLSTTWDTCPTRPPCIFITGASVREMDVADLRH